MYLLSALDDGVARFLGHAPVTVYFPRLEQIADLLETRVTDERYDHLNWAKRDDGAFSGCALGWTIELAPEVLGITRPDGWTDPGKVEYAGKDGDFTFGDLSNLLRLGGLEDGAGVAARLFVGLGHGRTRQEQIDLLRAAARSKKAQSRS